MPSGERLAIRSGLDDDFVDLRILLGSFNHWLGGGQVIGIVRSVALAVAIRDELGDDRGVLDNRLVERDFHLLRGGRNCLSVRSRAVLLFARPRSLAVEATATVPEPQWLS